MNMPSLLVLLLAAALRGAAGFNPAVAPYSAFTFNRILTACVDTGAAASAEAVTRRWISEHVLSLGLCPYASKPFVEEQIRYSVVDAESNVELVGEFFTEAQLLLESDPGELATTMLIAPSYPGGIEDFYELYEWLTDLLEDEDEPLLRGRLQPAFFHPEWTFSGLPADAPIHFEKRAPLPTINLLRQADLDAVSKKGLEQGVIVSKEIGEHNAAALEGAGYDAMRALFAERLAPGSPADPAA